MSSSNIYTYLYMYVYTYKYIKVPLNTYSRVNEPLHTTSRIVWTVDVIFHLRHSYSCVMITHGFNLHFCWKK